MKNSKITNNYKTLYIIFVLLSILSTAIPLGVYVIKGYINADLTAEKVGLTCTIMVAIILTAVNLIFKYNIRSTIWILLLGIYFCLDNVLNLIILIAVFTILDEFVLTPLKKLFKEKYSINKEIDKRL